MEDLRHLTDQQHTLPVIAARNAGAVEVADVMATLQPRRTQSPVT